MIDFIPSDQMKKYFEEIGFGFSDFEKATLIWNVNNCKWRERLDSLQELNNQTDDETTKEQIVGRIQYEEMMLKTFGENKDGMYIYVVLDATDCACGYFLKSYVALSYATKYANKHQETYSIEKQLLIKEDMVPMVRSGMRLNPNMFKYYNSEELVQYEGYGVSRIVLDSNGDITSISSNEMSKEKEEQVNPFNSQRFENRFIQIPFPFEKGTPVKYIPTGEYGIVATSKDEWKEFLERKKNGLYVDYVDYVDMSIEVVFLTEQGCWSHSHINPIYLENDMPQDDFMLAQALEALSDYWSENSHCGREDVVLRVSREYAESCRKKSPVENANSLEDILI